MPYVWNALQARYRDTATGRFVAKSTVLGYLQDSMAASSNMVGTLTDSYNSKSISSKDFMKAFKQEIKEEFIRQYIVGRGGLPSMDQSDWGRLGAMIKEQYNFANGFADDLAGLSEAQVTARGAMYVQAAGAAHAQGMKIAVGLSGNFTEEFWQLGDAEHCADCEALNANGWVQIGELGAIPRGGDTACLVNCQCEILYR